jgi:hypothetical protein
MKGFVATAALAFVAAAVHAEEMTTRNVPYTLGKPTFFGSGCPKNTVAVIPSSDAKTFSVLLSDFDAKTTSKTTRERKSCNLAIPINVKPGFSVAINKFDYRGNVYVPNQPNSYAEFSAEYFFAGSRGPLADYKYNQNYNGNVFLSNTVTALTWSPCGASTNFRVNADVTAYKGKLTNKDVQIAVDSQDITVGGFRYYVQYRKCSL